MFTENLLFCTFAALSIIFSFFVIVSKNPVHSILSLILVFFNAAGLLIILGAEFLAMLFIIVYVGAVAVLFLFVIMMLNIKVANLTISMYRYLPISLLFGFVFFSELYLIFYVDLVSIDAYNMSVLLNNEGYHINYLNIWQSHVSFFNNVVVLGNLLYTYYSYLFIMSGIILLVSMIGAISLTLHRRNDIKRQYIYKQIQRDFDSAVSWKH
jgi:NADH-quinone oxidoreductase subunit J